MFKILIEGQVVSVSGIRKLLKRTQVMCVGVVAKRTASGHARLRSFRVMADKSSASSENSRLSILVSDVCYAIVRSWGIAVPKQNSIGGS